MKVLFVCTGNICRSPTAEGLFNHHAKQAGLMYQGDSAGTHAYHVGESPDPRSIMAAERYGVDISTQVARKVSHEDFHEFDYIFALDSGHLESLEKIKPRNAQSQLHLLLPFAGLNQRDVPDPYYGGEVGFQEVYHLLDVATRNLLTLLK